MIAIRVLYYLLFYTFSLPALALTHVVDLINSPYVTRDTHGRAKGRVVYEINPNGELGTFVTQLLRKRRT